MTLFDNAKLLPEDKYQKVCPDEFYVHDHYHCCDKSLWDPNDDQELQVWSNNKGKQYCFIAAIQGPSPTGYAKGKNLAGLVPNSFCFFCPNQNEQTGKYHKVFNGKTFSSW